MTINKEIMEKMQAFVANPSNETLTPIGGLSYRCLLNCLLVGDMAFCPEMCPGLILMNVEDHGSNITYRICSFYELKRLWEIDQAKAVLYVIQLLACIESYVGVNSKTPKDGK
jgi:hypothetical protein